MDNIIGFASSIEPGRRVHMIENVQYGLVGQDHAMCWHLGQTCMYGNGGSYMATFLWRKELSTRPLARTRLKLPGATEFSKKVARRASEFSW